MCQVVLMQLANAHGDVLPLRRRLVHKHVRDGGGHLDAVLLPGGVGEVGDDGGGAQVPQVLDRRLVRDVGQDCDEPEEILPQLVNM